MNDDIQFTTQQIVCNLKKIREEKNISQLELAHRAGNSQNMVTNIETGKLSQTLQTQLKICTALDISPSKLFPQENNDDKSYIKQKIISDIEKYL